MFAENGDVISGGNFHGAPLALALDYAAIALTDLMSISERRIDRLVNPDLNEGLPPFLARKPGLQSGFMIAHVAAASLVERSQSPGASSQRRQCADLRRERRIMFPWE